MKVKKKVEGLETRKLRIGWFSFSCCEDSTIVFTELLNDHFEEWSKIVDFAYIRVLRGKNDMTNLDVAFVEGAIASDREKKMLLEIRKNCKKLVAIGSCANTGGPSAQRNMFSKELEKEIEFLLRKFHQSDKVHKLEDLVRVDAKVPGCPMSEEKFLEVLNKMLVGFGVVK